MSRLILLPGLGADARLFGPQDADSSAAGRFRSAHADQVNGFVRLMLERG